MENPLPLTLGNQAFRNKDYATAIKQYLIALQQMPGLSDSINTNLTLARTRLQREQPNAPQSFATSATPTPKIAVVVHVYYPEIWPEIAQYLKAITYPFDLFVTTTTEQAGTVIPVITTDFPNARISIQPNSGMDVLPFLILIPLLITAGYVAVCKLHTKRGDGGEEGTQWRRALLNPLIGDNAVFSEVVQAFVQHADLQLVGPASLYLSARKLMFDNEPNIKYVLEQIEGRALSVEDWGFFAGSMFWVRPTTLQKLAQGVAYLQTQSSEYQADGQISHAVERLLGLVPVLHQGQVGLLHSAVTASARRYVLQIVAAHTQISQANIADLMRQYANLEISLMHLRESGQFDAQHYLAQNPGLVGQDVDLLAHYLLVGRFGNFKLQTNTAPALLSQPGSFNILFVLYQNINSNGGLHVQLHAARLIEQGANYCVAVPDQYWIGPETTGAANSIAPLIDPTHVVPFSKLLAPDAGVPFADGRGPDFIHAWTPREIVRDFVERLRQRVPCPLIIHLEDNEEHLTAVTVGRPFDTLTQMSMAELDALIPVNRYHPLRGRAFLDQAQGLTLIIETLERFNTRQVPTLVLPPPVDERLFYPRPLNLALRRELGIPDSHLVLAYTGNVHEANRDEVQELYRAVGLLNQQGCPTILLRTGMGGEDLDSNRHYIKHLGWVERERVPEILAAADILVQPGVPGAFNAERVPSKLPEYLAMGRPVVLPRTNLGLKVEHGRAGYVLDKADAAGIVAAITAIRKDSSLAKKLADGGVEFYLREFSADFMNTKIISYFYRQFKDILTVDHHTDARFSRFRELEKKFGTDPSDMQNAYYFGMACYDIGNKTRAKQIIDRISRSGYKKLANVAKHINHQILLDS